MDKWKSRGGNSEKGREGKRREEKGREGKRREEKRKEDKRREEKKRGSGKRKSEKKDCGSGGSKRRLANAAGAEPSGQMRNEKLHAVVARSTFGSCAIEKAHAVVWREANFQVKMYKTHQVRTTFGSWDVEKVHAVVARSTFRSQKFEKTEGGSEHFWTFGCRFAWQAQGILHLAKSESKTWGFCSSFKSVGRRGTFEEDLERWMSRGRRSTRDAWGRCVRRSGRRFPEKCCILEHAKMILHDRCNTSYNLSSLFRGRRNRSPYLILATGHALLLTLKLPLSSEFI